MRKTGLILPLILLILLLMPETKEYVSLTASAEGTAASGKLPASYDCREDGRAPVIKSQGALGTCWALTASSALEASLMPERHMVFSADHFFLNSGFVLDQGTGGDYKMIMAYLCGWYGPVTEEEDPYGDGVSPDGLLPAVHVGEIRYLEGRPPSCYKEMILEYGPVQTSLCMDRSMTSDRSGWYSAGHAAFYYPKKETPTHDVLILGWDDTFPRTSFATQPPLDGAWICQNTWGEDFGDRGIFYVSYADPNIACGGLSYCRVEDAEPDTRICQNDPCGWQGRLGYEQENCFMANIYQAGEDEQLEGMGFYSTGTHTTYDLYLVRSYSGTESLKNREWLTSGTIWDQGYFSVSLPQPQPLEDGERFAVIAEIWTEDAKRPVAVELKKDAFTEEVSLEGKEGYISLYGDKWENTEEKYGTNVCLKAYLRKQ